MIRKPAVCLVCATLAAHSMLALAANSCRDAEEKALGHAIGVLVYERILKDYAGIVSIADVAAGMQQASGSTNRLTLTREDSSGRNASTLTMSLARAQATIRRWRSQSERVGERFIAEFKNLAPYQHKNGLMVRVHDTSNSPVGKMFSHCLDKPDTNDHWQVCYQQLTIDESAVCEANNMALETISARAEEFERDNSNRSIQSLAYGVFSQDEVIEGWSTTFEMIDDGTLSLKNEIEANTDADQGHDVQQILEVVIPPSIGYGSKGIPGKVQPDETLWFVMAVR